MNGKGSKRRPTGKGLYNREAELVALNLEIFYEKDEAVKEQLRKKRDKLKESLYGK